MATIFRGAINFIVLQAIALGLCVVFPQIVLWLPGIVYTR